MIMTPVNGSDPPSESVAAAAPAAVRRPLPRGLTVITSVLFFATLACVVLFLFGDRPARVFGAAAAPICLLAAIGIAARINWVRIMIIIMLVSAVSAEAFWIILTRLDPTIRPPDVFPTTVRIALTFWLLSYLMRRDVRLLFMEKS